MFFLEWLYLKAALLIAFIVLSTTPLEKFKHPVIFHWGFYCVVFIIGAVLWSFY